MPNFKRNSKIWIRKKFDVETILWQTILTEQLCRLNKHIYAITYHTKCTTKQSFTCKNGNQFETGQYTGKFVFVFQCSCPIVHYQKCFAVQSKFWPWKLASKNKVTFKWLKRWHTFEESCELWKRIKRQPAETTEGLKIWGPSSMK